MNEKNLAADDPSSFLSRHPATTAILYTVIGAFPLFLSGAYAVRLQDEFGFGSAEFGYAVAAFFVFGTVGANRLGPWVDRLGTTFGLRIATSLSVVSALLIAFVASSWQWLALALAVSGLANAIANLATNRLIASHTASSKQGSGFGAKQAGIPLASLTAGFLVSVLGPIPYEAVYVAYAVVAAALLLAAPGVAEHGTGSTRPIREYGASFKQLLVLALAGAFAGTTGNSLAVFAVDAFEGAGFTEAGAASLLVAGSAASIVVRALVGRIVDWRQSDGYQELTTLMVAGSIGFLVAASSEENTTVLILGIIGAFAAAWGWPAVIYYTAVRNSDAPPATASGIVLTGVFIGMMLGPPIVGLIADAAGFRWAWAASSILIGLGAISVITSRSIGAHRAASAHGSDRDPK